MSLTGPAKWCNGAEKFVWFRISFRRLSTLATSDLLWQPLRGKPAVLFSSSVGVYQSGVDASCIALWVGGRLRSFLFAGILAVLHVTSRHTYGGIPLLCASRPAGA